MIKNGLFSLSNLYVQISVYVFGLFVVTACGNIDATLTRSTQDINSETDPPTSTPIPEVPNKTRFEPDVVFGELVKTQYGTANYEIRATIGEISEKRASLNGNGWSVEGVFYE